MYRVVGVIILLGLVVVGFGYPVTPWRFPLPSPLSAALAAARIQPTPTPTPRPTLTPAVSTLEPQRQPTDAAEPVALVSSKPKPGQDTANHGEQIVSVGLPERLTIESIGVDARFEFVGLTADGSMDVPKDPAKVAWYKLGPRPGEQGNALVAGHVDWGGKLAVFWRLRDLQPGNSVEITTADGKKVPFVVQWQRWYDAGTTAVDEVFAQTAAPELTLITCGGDFDHTTRQYLSRIVVRAALRR